MRKLKRALASFFYGNIRRISDYFVRRGWLIADPIEPMPLRRPVYRTTR